MREMGANGGREDEAQSGSATRTVSWFSVELSWFFLVGSKRSGTSCPERNDDLEKIYEVRA
jgi:hypothetical protein